MDTLQQASTAMEDGELDMQKLIRILLESALNAIMDEQADMACEGGANSRNGYRERGLLTPAGKITLRIPKLRCGTYFPDGILERYSRVDKAVAAAVAEMYATGVATRKVERVAAKVGLDSYQDRGARPWRKTVAPRMTASGLSCPGVADENPSLVAPYDEVESIRPPRVAKKSIGRRSLERFVQYSCDCYLPLGAT